MTQKKTALVTGGAGFIGAHVVRELLSKDVEVVVLDDLSGGKRQHVPHAATFIEGSITDEVIVGELFQTFAFDYVYHLAAYAAEGLSHFIRKFNYTNNVLGSVGLINESIKHNVKCFVFTSSIAAYGNVDPPMREDQEMRPEDPYGIAKLAVELDLKAARHQFGLNSVIFRPHNVYGEYQNLGDPYRNVVGIFMNQIMSDRPMTIFGDGEQQRAFSYVGDIAPMIAHAPWNERALNEVFNVGADTPYTVNALAKAVAHAFYVPDHPIRHLAARKEVKVAYADHSKAHQVFGKPCPSSLEDGLARMAAWAKETGIQSGQAFAGVEIEQGLPPSWAKLARQNSASPAGQKV